MISWPYARIASRTRGRRQAPGSTGRRAPRTAAASPSSAAWRSGSTNRRIVAANAIGGGSARLSRSSSSRLRRPTRSRNRATRSSIVSAGRRADRAGGPSYGRPGAGVGSRASRLRGSSRRDSSGDTARLVVAGSKRRVAQPVVGNIDLFRAGEAIVAGDIGMVTLEERPPGDLDRLEACLGRQLEDPVEIDIRNGRSAHGSDPRLGQRSPGREAVEL